MNRFAALCTATALAPYADRLQPNPSRTARHPRRRRQGDQDNETQWNADWAAKDAAETSAHYTDDAVLMVSGGPPTVGKDDPEDERNHGRRSRDLPPVPFVQSRRSHLRRPRLFPGTYTLTVTDPTTKKPTNDHGGYVTVYHRRADSSWKTVADSVTSEVPPAMPAPAKKH